MVQVINDEYGGNVFGRLGKGIGKGLSEQVPKEIERSRLSSGLKKLGDEAESQNLSPLQVFTRAAGVPGITPQHLYTMAPIINQQVQKSNFLNRGKGGQQSDVSESNVPSMESGGQASVQAPRQGAPTSTGENGFASPSQISDYKQNTLQEPSFDQINDLAKNYLQEGITQDPQEATSLAQRELTQNRAAQQERNSALRNDFNKRIALDLQGSGLGDYKDISGEIQNSLLDQGEYMVNKLGLSPEAASQKLSDIAKDLGKTTNKLKDTGSFYNMFNSRQSKINSLKSQKKDFEKYGYGEQFDDMAAAELGITPLAAANVLDPLKNKEIENAISSTKKISQKSTENNIKQNDLDKIIKSISPKDNLFAIEHKLREKALDINQFKSRILELQDANEIALTPKQKRQLDRTVSMGFLGDLLFESL